MNTHRFTALQMVGSFALFAAALASGTALAGPPYPVPYPDGGVIRYSGRATVLDARLSLLTSNSRLVLGDTGEINPTGETRENTLLTVDNPPPLEVRSKTVTAIASGAGGISAASAAVEKLALNASALRVTADVIEASSTAECTLESSTVATRGSSSIANLQINGRPINVSGMPNQRIVIPLVATIVINEQTNPDVNTITVTALRITVPGLRGVVGSEVIVSRATSGILTCSGKKPSYY